MSIVYTVIRFFASSFWFIWPLCIAADYFCSRSPALKYEWVRGLRWLPRVCHCLAIAAVVTWMGVEHFWLHVVGIHHHGGAEKYWVGLASFGLCMLFAFGFDARGTRESARNRAAGAGSIIGAALLAVLVIVGALSGLLALGRYDFEIFLLIFLLALLTMRCLPRSGCCEICLMVFAIMAGVSVVGLIVCWFAAGLTFFGQLAYMNDDLWYLGFASLMVFGLLCGAAWLEGWRERREEAVCDAA